MARWALQDQTTTRGEQRGGYLRMTFNGKRVADVFPFAAGENPDHVISRAESVIAVLNAVDEWRRISYEDGTPHERLIHTDEGTILMRAIDSVLTI